MNLKKVWDKTWYFLWKDDSFKGWLVSIIFLFVIAKFVFFPALSLITGSPLPLAIVESCSMYHKEDSLSNFEQWYQRHESKYNNFEITQKDFENFPLKKGFNKGDIILITRANPEKIEKGDIIIFASSIRGAPIIHRVVNIYQEEGKRYFATMGDNNNGQLSFEKKISEEQLIGKTSYRIAPLMGWIKLIFYEPSRSSSERGFCEEN